MTQHQLQRLQDRPAARHAKTRRHRQVQAQPALPQPAGQQRRRLLHHLRELSSLGFRQRPPVQQEWRRARENRSRRRQVPAWKSLKPPADESVWRKSRAERDRARTAGQQSRLPAQERQSAGQQLSLAADHRGREPNHREHATGRALSELNKVATKFLLIS
jgi:hypothetical protein